MDATALGRNPIPGDSPAGFDAKYEEEYAAVSAEIGKLGSATQGGAVSWDKIAAQGQIILEQKSKDLQIAAYVGIAWQEIHGIEGLRSAVDLFLAMLSTFWETAFPPLAKLRRRTNAFDWWHERAYAGLQQYGDAPALPAETLDGLSEALRNLDQLAAERMPDAAPLRDMHEAVRRLPVEAAPSAPEENPEQPHQATQASTPTPTPQQESVQAPPQPSAAPKQPSPPAQPATATPDADDDAQAALKDFAAAAVRYALLAHRSSPDAPLPWQVLRLALWGKVAALPPATEGQTHIPPPDADHLAGLRRMLETGKYREAALGGEDLFSASIFCLDAQYIINAALEGLGDAYAEAGQRVREETARFVQRLKGVENLAFDGGMPFADQNTLDWLASLNETAPPASGAALPAANAVSASQPTDDAATDTAAEAERLAASHQLVAALELLERAQGDSPAANMRLRAHQLRLLSAARERDTAAALAQGLLEELEKRQVESWDVALAIEVLLSV
ncbi:MAG: type VI secretion system protein TssA, partial [Desulfovibrio sp.]|nr:type VI secretion system protein TssA [Desulfovibrio sp.]